MAKSLRSKWRRKCRAVKRERYGVKELERLKKTLGILNDTDKTKKDEVMQDLSVITMSVDAEKIKKDIVKKTSMNIIKEDDADSGMEENIEVKRDGSSQSRIYNTKTMKDQFGQYPVWMHPRKIKANKKTQQKNKINKKRNHRTVLKKNGKKSKA